MKKYLVYATGTLATLALLYAVITAFAIWQYIFEGRTGSWDIWGAPIRFLLNL